jgi:hypothetical protein
MQSILKRSTGIAYCRRLLSVQQDQDMRKAFSNLPQLPVFGSVAEERLHLEQTLAGAFRIFS